MNRTNEENRNGIREFSIERDRGKASPKVSCYCMISCDTSNFIMKSFSVSICLSVCLSVHRSIYLYFNLTERVRVSSTTNRCWKCRCTIVYRTSMYSNRFSIMWNTKNLLCNPLWCFVVECGIVLKRVESRKFAPTMNWSTWVSCKSVTLPPQSSIICPRTQIFSRSHWHSRAV